MLLLQRGKRTAPRTESHLPCPLPNRKGLSPGPSPLLCRVLPRSLTSLPRHRLHPCRLQDRPSRKRPPLRPNSWPPSTIGRRSLASISLSTGFHCRNPFPFPSELPMAKSWATWCWMQVPKWWRSPCRVASSGCFPRPRPTPIKRSRYGWTTRTSSNVSPTSMKCGRNVKRTCGPGGPKREPVRPLSLPIPPPLWRTSLEVHSDLLPVPPKPPRGAACSRTFRLPWISATASSAFAGIAARSELKRRKVENKFALFRFAVFLTYKLIPLKSHGH